MAHGSVCVHNVHVCSLHAFDIKTPQLQGIIGMYDTQIKVLQMFMLAYDSFVTHARWQFV